MIFKLYKASVASLILSIILLSSVANAGLITDTKNNSFIDETTGLEWMDFGVNNTYSYDQVTSLLSTEYAGWSLPTESDVLTLWHNAFSEVASHGSQSSGSTYALYHANKVAGVTLFDPIFEIMGFNNSPYAQGFFRDTTGSTSYAGFNNDPTRSFAMAHVYGRNVNLDFFNTFDTPNFSTMLVKAASVPEPSTLAIFALGLFGLSSGRFKKQS
jgi:hypothetical protein